MSGIIDCRRYLTIDSRSGSISFYEKPGFYSGREVHREAGVCVKGRIALHKHCILARVGRDRALSKGYILVYAESGFWSDDFMCHRPKSNIMIEHGLH